MRNKLEHLLLSVLLALTVLLGLSFWLNTVFNFNIFCAAHWNELAKLQASQTPISTGFYIAFIIAIFVFVLGFYLIYRQEIRHIHIIKTKPTTISNSVVQTPAVAPIEENEVVEIPEPVISVSRPPRLNLPNNITQIAEQKNTARTNIQKEDKPSTNPYNSIISEIFSSAGYTVKPNPKISGWEPGLFAIGNNEIVWIGGVDCDIEKITNAIQKLNSVFTETLEDIPIRIHSFILDTMNKYDANDSVMIFKSIDELKDFVNAHPADNIGDEDIESFNSYSEYIDTIIKYIQNI